MRRRPSVEPEGKFVKVIIKVSGACCSLIGSQKPPLQERCYSVRSRKQLVSALPTAADYFDGVVVPESLQSGIPSPAVCDDGGSILDSPLNERFEARCGDIRDPSEANAADGALAAHFCCNRHNGLAFRLPAANALPEPADIGLVDLDEVRQPITSWADHGVP